MDISRDKVREHGRNSAPVPLRPPRNSHDSNTSLNKLYDAHAVPTRRGGGRYKSPGPGDPEGDTRLDYVAYVFSYFSVLSLFVDRTN
jgi:hypothetical protein